MDSSVLLKDIEHVLRNKIAILPGARDREGRPIVFVPVNGGLDDVNRDHLRNLLKYLFEVTADDAKKRGFLFVVDMRKGTTWKDVKPILECLQDFFSRLIALVLILKPENFWRRPTGFSTGKYEFPTQMCSADGLAKYADVHQILREFGGTLAYDHDEWMSFRDDVERAESKSRDMLAHFSRCAGTMSDAEAPVDLETAHVAMRQHEDLQISLAAAAIESLEADVSALEQRIFAPELATDNGAHLSPRGAHSNPDLTAVVPQLRQRVDALFAARIDVLHQWEAKKQELDQCFQLKSFENDVEMRCIRFREKYDEIKRNFHDTGVNENETKSLIDEFSALADAIRAEEVVYNQTMNNGRRLLKLYAANVNGAAAAAADGGNNTVRSIEAMLHQVDRRWQCLLQLAEQRERLLKGALIVHQKCNLFLDNFNMWINNVGVNPDTIAGESHERMKAALESHDNFHKQFESVYSEAYASATSLLKQMKKIFGERNAGQTQSYVGLVDLINRVTMAKRQLHGIWKSRRETIECRMSSAAFFSDLRLVIEWLEVNGEPFLRRKIAIGHNRETAENLSRNHEQFRTVARSTYENAKQLFHIAQVLRNSGEVDSDAIARASADLRCRIDNFRKKIDMRTNLLFIASNFFLHFDEIMAWYSHMDKRSELVVYVPDSVELCEQNKEKLLTENDGTTQAFARVKHESLQLHDALKQQKKLLNVDNSEAIRHVEELISRIEACHMREKERWPGQRAHLNAASKVASFLHDCAEIKKQLLSWREDLNSLKHSIANKAEVIVHYHRQNTESVRTAIQDALNQMGEIVQLIQNMNLHLIIESTQQSAEEAVTAATKELQFLEVKVMEIASEVTDRIEVQLQVTKLNKSVNEMMKVIQDYQNQLHRMNFIPGVLEEANFALEKHEHFRRECEKLEKTLIELQQKCHMDVMIVNSPQYSVASNMIEQLRLKWSHLVGQMENRSKLLHRSITFFTCVNNVIPVADNMEKNFMNDRSDYCLQLLGALLSTAALEKVLTQTLECLTKHVDRKEKFIQAITYAQNVSDNLLKSIYRCDNATTENVALREAQVAGFKQQIQESKERILDLWFQRKMWIDQCHKIILLQLSATQINDQIKETFAKYSQLHVGVDQLRHQSQPSAQRAALLKEKSDEFAGLKAFVKIQEVRERASTCIHHIAKIRKICVDAGHRQLIDQAEKCVKEAFSRIVGFSNQIELGLKEASGEPSDAGSGCSTLTLASSASFASRRNVTSDASTYGKEELSLDSTIEDNIQKTAVAAGGDAVAGAVAANDAANEVNRKLIAPMNELIKTEKNYVDMLRICVTVYLETYRMAGSMCPQPLRNKEAEIFGNVEELYAFHSNVFLPDLLDYERHPEDVGYCFIQWLERLKELYADYCLNKQENNHLIGLPEAIQFFSEIRQQNDLPHSSSLESVVIQPVQRIARYTLMLEKLMKRSASSKREIKEVFEAVSNIPKLANDRMHLKNFENAEEHRVGDFVMQDAFVIFEPKRYFKRERELQVFLFESNIVFTKREEIGNRMRYVYKDSMLLREIHVVEHVEGDNTKFGLRKENQIHQNDSTIILKTTNESNRMLWVKTLRNLKLDLKLESKKSTCLDAGSINSVQSGNRGSQVSRDSNTSVATGGGSVADRFSVASTSSAASVTGNVIAPPSATTVLPAGAGVRNAEQFFVSEDFTATEEGQISVKIGQRVEVINSLGGVNGTNIDRSSSKEFVAVAVIHDETDALGASRGNVPFRILMPVVETDAIGDAPGIFRDVNYSNADGSSSNTNISKRSSLRRFFNNASASSDTPPAVTQENALATAAGQSLASTSANAVESPAAAATPTTSSSAAGDTCPLLSTVERRDEPASSSSAQQQPSTSADVDLPPPMSQLSSEPVTAAVNADSGAAEPAFDPNSVLMNDKRHESGSDSPPHGVDSAAGTPQGDGGASKMSAEEASRMKRSYVLNELVETERVYVQDLTSVVEGYIGNLSTMELPEDLRGKDKIIFANIAQILDFHKTTFLKDIEPCIENYEAVGHAFIKHERRLNTYYVKYCQNKPKSDFLVSQDSFEQFFAETKQKLGHKVALCDLLIKPIQRITKYQLMLSDILKYTHRAHDKADVLERALEVMRVVPKACDDMMQVGRLQNFEGNLTAQGRLLYQGTLQISDGPPSQPFRGKDRRVFLFEQSAIIADCIPPRKEYGNPTYIFKNQIMVNKMVLEDKVADEPTRFVLTSNDPSQPAVFVAQAASLEDKQQWLAKISAQLDQQKTFLAALVDPKKYQNQLASSVGALNLGGKKDSSGSLGMTTPPGSASSTNNFASPKHHNNSSTKTASKLFGFGKSKS